MDILARMRNTTPGDLAKVTGDFSDLPTPVYVSRKPKNMVRIVEGADDLRHPNAGQGGGSGMSRTQDWSDRVDEDYPSKAQVDDYIAHTGGDICNNPTCCAPASDDPRSEGQVRYIDSLIADLTALDADLGAQARTYTDGMTEHGRWTRNDGKIKGTISTWIDRLKAKIVELKASGVRPAPIGAADDTEFQAIPNGYYAIGDAGPDDIHFFRVSRFRDGGIKVQEQASDTLHPVRRGGRRTGILRAILSVGPANASALYGQTIGRCGRCNRTLTDSLSRSRGIGPDCWEKM